MVGLEPPAGGCQPQADVSLGPEISCTRPTGRVLSGPKCRRRFPSSTGRTPSAPWRPWGYAAATGEQALTGEITAIPTPGHTPGHMSLAIVSGGARPDHGPCSHPSGPGHRARLVSDFRHGPAACRADQAAVLRPGRGGGSHPGRLATFPLQGSGASCAWRDAAIGKDYRAIG